jgi:hypothetical protein
MKYEGSTCIPPSTTQLLWKFMVAYVQWTRKNHLMFTLHKFFPEVLTTNICSVTSALRMATIFAKALPVLAASSFETNCYKLGPAQTLRKLVLF